MPRLLRDPPLGSADRAREGFNSVKPFSVNWISELALARTQPITIAECWSLEHEITWLSLES